MTYTARYQRNHERIHDAAIDLFDERGFEETTVTAIARRAGVARATVFNHFPEKAGILVEFSRRLDALVIRAARLARVQDFRGRLTALFAAIGPISAAHRQVMAEAMRQAGSAEPVASAGTEMDAEMDAEMRAFFREIAAAGQAEGDLRPELDADFLADLLLGLLTATTHQWLAHESPTSLQGELIARFEALIDGIGVR